MSALFTAKFGILGCKHTTLELIDGVLRAGFRPEGVLTLSPALGEKNKVAGYMDLTEALRAREIPVFYANDYTLKSEQDFAQISSLSWDLILVNGWQRLVPEFWLKKLSRGAFGMHGSSQPLPHGRGRSPLNWSLIQGKKQFYTHLFKYTPGVDDGPIVDVQIFDITPWDTALTLHYNNTLSMIQMCTRHLASLLEGTAVLSPQPGGSESYYPKRSDEDGLIFWEDSSEQIYNLVRGVTRPFPGAFGFVGDDAAKKVFIWKAIPFDSRLHFPKSVPGEILHVFKRGDWQGGDWLVKTGDSSLLVQESTGYAVSDKDVGQVLGQCKTPRKLWKNLPL